MIWLLLSILSSTIIMVVFKLFKQFEISTFHAIVVNYFAAALIGFLFIGNTSLKLQGLGTWYPFAILLGSLFIGLFFLIGLTTQKLGINVATIAMKLGYVLPIILAFAFYKEDVSAIKLIGIILTLFALVFSSLSSDKKRANFDRKLFIYPLIIFVGSGICDAIVQYTEKTFFPNGNTSFFIIFLFITAAALGLFIALWRDIKSKEWNFTIKNILAGVLLGVPNYFSIYFMFKALSAFPGKSVLVFPANNIGIVLLSTFIGYLIFHEKMSTLNKWGFVLAIASILLIYYESIVQIL